MQEVLCTANTIIVTKITLWLDAGTLYKKLYGYIYLNVYSAKSDQEYKMMWLDFLENGKGLCIFLSMHVVSSLYVV